MRRIQEMIASNLQTVAAIRKFAKMKVVGQFEF